MKPRIAQYGISHAHADGKASVLKTFADVEFAGVFEPNSETRAAKGGAEAYASVHWLASREDLLDDPSIAAVAIEGDVGQNLAWAREALEHGKHIWLDKPAGTDWAEFQSLVALAKERHLLIQLGYMYRYNPGFQFILDWASSGRLGAVFSARGRMSTTHSNERRRKLSAYPGGMVFELLCHLMDIVIAMLGRPQRVTSYLHNELGSYPTFFDNTATVFEYPEALVILESSALEVAPFESRRFEVHGTRGSIILEPFEAIPSLRLCLDEDRDGYHGGWQDVPVQAVPRYVDSLRALVADIRGDKAPDRSLDHELLVQETVLRAAGILRE